MNNWDYEFVGYGIGRYVMVLYTFAMKDIKNGTIKVTYQHRTHFISVEDVDRFQDGVEQVLRIAVENPQITIGDLLDKLQVKE